MEPLEARVTAFLAKFNDMEEVMEECKTRGVKVGGCKCDRMQSDSLWIDVKNWPTGVSYHPTAQGCAAALVMLGSLVLREFPCPVLKQIHQFHMERMK